ncbi:MAG: alpha/beta fold hydrolase [Candidatus Promineifilaceae bacterium]
MATLDLESISLYFTHPRRQPGGPALLLLHGVGGSHLAWPRHLQKLPGRDIYSLDLPGHGRSTGQYDTIAGFGSAVDSFARALGLRNTCVAGHSMGGAIALWLARQHPSWLSSLVLVGSGARLPVSPQILSGLQQQPDAVVEQIMAYAWAAPGPLAGAAAAEMRSAGADTLLGGFMACDSFDARDWLSEVELPALIVCGTEDRMTPLALSRELAADLPNATLQLIEGAGHYVTLERPGAVATAVAAFLAGLETAENGGQV